MEKRGRSSVDRTSITEYYDRQIADLENREDYEDFKAHWDDRIADLRKERSEAIRNALAVIPARFRDAETDLELPESVGLYLYGPVGVGKTHVAAGIVHKEAMLGSHCKWVSMSGWLADLRASFNGAEPPEQAGSFGWSDVLVLDDLGAEKPSDWALESIFLLVNTVYERERTRLIVTSNLSLADLSKRVGSRIASRLAEMCEPLELTGADRRVTIARSRKTAKAQR